VRFLDDIPPDAAKTGALGNRAIVEAVAEAAADFKFPLVVDPVMVSKHGVRLMAKDAVEAIRTKLIPRAIPGHAQSRGSIRACRLRSP